MNENRPLTISVPEVARQLGISKPQAYELAKQDGFPAFHIGERRIVVHAALFEAWVKEQAEKGATA